MTKILTSDLKDLQLAVADLNAGNPVGIPTETVYGLAADAFSAAAVAQVYAVKARPSFDPVIVHVAAERATLACLIADGIVADTGFTPVASQKISNIINELWPGPLTVLLPRGPKIPEIVTAGSRWVGVRVPAHPVTQRLLSLYDGPLAAPSANRFGRISPTSAQDVLADLAGRINYIVDGGVCQHGVESTVVRVQEKGDAGLEVLRPGAISIETLREIAGDAEISLHPKGSGTIESPGQLDLHYAPSKPVWRVLVAGETGVAEAMPARAFGVLYCTGAQQNSLSFQAVPTAVRVLSPKSDDQEAAQNLFRHLRELDAAENVESILVCPPPTNTGLWLAIADRLQRAAAGRAVRL